MEKDRNHYIIPIFVPMEGCPNNCIFCDQNTITGSINNEITDAENKIVEYLKTIKSGSIVEISFFGGTFTGIDINRQNLFLNIAKKYKDNGDIKYIRLSTRPDYINHEILKNLKHHSVDIIEIGVQSMDDDVLKKSRRGHTKVDTINASKLIKSYGFTLGHQVMLGLPGSSGECELNTINELIPLKPDFIRLYPTLVIKGTPLSNLYLNGEYTPYSLSECVEICGEIYYKLSVHNIKIIRIGLLNTENINSGGDIVAGPFHPAFGELVEGYVLNTCIENFLKNVMEDIVVYLNKRDISKLYTDKKKYFKLLLSKIHNGIKVIGNDQVRPSCVEINTKNEKYMYSFRDFCIKFFYK